MELDEAKALMDKKSMGPPYSALERRIVETFGLPPEVACILVTFLDNEGVLDYDNLKEVYYEEVANA